MFSHRSVVTPPNWRLQCKTISSACVIHLRLEAEYNEEWCLFISNVYACGRNPDWIMVRKKVEINECEMMLRRLLRL